MTWIMVAAVHTPSIVVNQGLGGRTIVADRALILCINRGSASLKYAVYRRETDQLSLQKSGSLGACTDHIQY
jgi:hypothetical protein